MTDQLVRHKAAGLVCGLLVLFAITGCSSTRIASTGDDLGTVNLLAERRVAHVTLAGGEIVRARALLIEADSVSWVDARTGEFRTAATPQVREVRFTSRGRGALEGAGLGAAIGGGALGGLFTLGMVASGWSWEWGGMISGAVLGLPIGAAAGAGMGERSTYVIDLPASAPPAQVADAVDPERSEPIEWE
jgi:hypothetical protein